MVYSTKHSAESNECPLAPTELGACVDTAHTTERTFAVLAQESIKEQLSKIRDEHTKTVFTYLYTHIRNKTGLPSGYFDYLAFSHIGERDHDSHICFSITIEGYPELLVTVERVPNSQDFKLKPLTVDAPIIDGDTTTLPANSSASSDGGLDATSITEFCNPNIGMELLAKMIDSGLQCVLSEKSKAVTSVGIAQVKSATEGEERIARLESLIGALRNHREYQAELLGKRQQYSIYSPELLQKFDALVVDNVEVMLIICALILNLYTDVLTKGERTAIIQDEFKRKFMEDIRESKGKEGGERLVEIHSALTGVNLEIAQSTFNGKLPRLKSFAQARGIIVREADDANGELEIFQALRNMKDTLLVIITELKVMKGV